jgi:outer membrane protein
MYRIVINILFVVVFFHTSYSQVVLELDDIVRISRCDNLSARKAYVEKKNAYWNWQIHRSNLRPQLRLDTKLTEFAKGVTPVSQEDGSIEMKTVNQNSTSANLALLQPIPFMGAEIFMNSYLFRFDNFSNKSHSYSSQPLELGIQMPVFQYRKLKWDKIISPVVYLESKKEYDRQLELSAYYSVVMFFQNLSDRHDWNMANSNMKSNGELFRISEEKYNMGQISKDELLQVKLMMVNAQKNLKAAQVRMENSALRLLTHLSLINISEFTPITPAAIPEFSISSAKAIEFAFNNNPESISFKRRLLEANADVARTNGETGVTGNLFATIGYGSNFDALPQWNNDLNQHASLQVGISIPILDWGRTHAARKQANMKRELEETIVLQEQIDFEKEIVTLVNVVEMLKDNIQIVIEADKIAQERYDIAFKRFLAGDISVLELNLAQKEKDLASSDLLSTKGEFWVNYYHLRMITLHDFIYNNSLVNNNETN